MVTLSHKSCDRVTLQHLNGVLEEEVYMRLPEGFEDLGNPGDIFLLMKATYGLRQAGRVWSKTLAATLSKMGFTQIKSDPSVYVQDQQGCARVVQGLLFGGIGEVVQHPEYSDGRVRVQIQFHGLSLWIFQ